jgi:hypothetical protein
MNKLLLLLGISFICLNHAEASRFNFPTQWRVKNSAGVPVYIQCEAKSQTRLHLLTPDGVPARTVYQYKWSSWEYNDGLGLGADQWNWLKMQVWSNQRMLLH